MKLAPFVAVLSVALFALVAAQAGQNDPPVLKWQGKKLPTIKMTDLKGKKITNASLRGKVAIIDFWATWCGPCKLASPVMQKLHQKYASKGLVVIGANTWETKPKNAASDYAKEHKYTYTFTEKNDALAKSLNITGIPTMLVVNKKGVISFVQVGIETPEKLQQLLESKVRPLLK